jgi:adenosyl cobinamide kinase/adenosyl cobinamide phosphate guanylyltransferase
MAPHARDSGINHLMGLVLLIGGARSGKSRLALRLAGESGNPVVFLATGEAGDDEMAERIALHRAERPAGWTTVEEPRDLVGAIADVPEGATLVVDCLSLWVANVLESRDVEREAREAAALAAARTTIAVTNEVGLGVVPATPLGRAYRDVLGRVNAIWAEAADEAYFVVAGRVLRLSELGA